VLEHLTSCLGVYALWYSYKLEVACNKYYHNPTLGEVGGWNSHSQSWGFGVLRDSRMFGVRQQRPKHLALGCS
jgi:hypothetical protein